MEQDLESQLAHLYRVYEAQQTAKMSEDLTLFLLEQFLELDPKMVHNQIFDRPHSARVVAAVAKARRRVPKPKL